MHIPPRQKRKVYLVRALKLWNLNIVYSKFCIKSQRNRRLKDIIAASLQKQSRQIKILSHKLSKCIWLWCLNSSFTLVACSRVRNTWQIFNFLHSYVTVASRIYLLNLLFYFCAVFCEYFFSLNHLLWTGHSLVTIWQIKTNADKNYLCPLIWKQGVSINKINIH